MMEASDQILVSIIIPAHNASDTIRDCLTALQNQDFDHANFEIIVVDDGSTDDTASIARSFSTTVISQEPKGAATARNKGAANSRGALLLFTDADCSPDPKWVRAMILPFEDPTVIGVKGTYRSQQRAMTARFVQAEYEWKYERMKKCSTIDFIDTYSAGFSASAFRSVGGFDESFPGASVEDQELSFRLHACGFKMIFAPEAVVRHRHADRWMIYLRKKYRIGFWKLRVLKLHPEKAIRDSHTPQLLKIQLPLSLLLVAGILCSLILSSPYLIMFLLVVWLVFSLPECMKCLKLDGLKLAVVAPWFTFLRSIGLASGLIHALIAGIPDKDRST